MTAVCAAALQHHAKGLPGDDALTCVVRVDGSSVEGLKEGLKGELAQAKVRLHRAASPPGCRLPVVSANAETGGLPGLTCADVCEWPALRTLLSCDEDLRRVRHDHPGEITVELLE